MLYRVFGKTGIKLSAIGYGTNRFNLNALKSEEGLCQTAQLLVDGVRRGINYIDCGHTYSADMAETVVRYAAETIRRENLECYFSTKVMYHEDKTESAARKRLECSLQAMGLDYVTFGFLWKVSSFEEFQASAKPEGICDGLRRAKDEGLIKHLCFSSHASSAETIKILESGYFEGCTISCNALNVGEYRALLDFADTQKIGVFTMNSLGGGMVPTLHGSWEGSAFPPNYTVAQKALSILYDEPAITCMLTSMADAQQLTENTAPFSSKQTLIVPNETDKAHFSGDKPKMCTRCRYCKGCPAGIPIADMMYAYSCRDLVGLMQGYGDSASWNNDEERQITKQIYNVRFYDDTKIPRTKNNPCLRCGRCESICTQHLPIISRIDEMYRRAAACNYSHEQRKNRLNELLNIPRYRKVAFFPAGHYTEYTINAYHEYFGDFPFELTVFDNDSAKWGKYESYIVKSPNEIGNVLPEVIVVTNYRYGDEIYDSLKKNQEVINHRIPVMKLHKKEDIAWW